MNCNLDLKLWDQSLWPVSITSETENKSNQAITRIIIQDLLPFEMMNVCSEYINILFSFNNNFKRLMSYWQTVMSDQQIHNNYIMNCLPRHEILQSILFWIFKHNSDFILSTSVYEQTHSSEDRVNKLKYYLCQVHKLLKYILLIYLHSTY